MRVIWSRQGPQQGDPGGPLLFALALHPALHALQARLGQEVYILAYSDDIILLVPYGRVAEALLAARDTLAALCDLSLRQDKCVVFDPTPGRVPEAPFRRGGALADVQWRGGGEDRGAGLLVVGSPIGSAAFADYALCAEREGPVQRAGNLFGVLPRLSTR